MTEAVVVSFISFGVSIGLKNIFGTKLTTAANAILVISTSPLFIFLFGVWLFGEEISPAQIVVLVLATLGVIVGIGFGALFLGEHLGLTYWICAMVIYAGLIITARTKSPMRIN